MASLKFSVICKANKNKYTFLVMLLTPCSLSLLCSFISLFFHFESSPIICVLLNHHVREFCFDCLHWFLSWLVIARLSVYGSAVKGVEKNVWKNWLFHLYLFATNIIYIQSIWRYTYISIISGIWRMFSGVLVHTSAMFKAVRLRNKLTAAINVFAHIHFCFYSCKKVKVYVFMLCCVQ